MTAPQTTVPVLIPSKKWIKMWAPVLLFALTAAYGGVNYCNIARQSERDEARPSDVIIVFGAAEYAGKPSPIFRARLDHGLALFRKGIAPMIITTGGPGDDPVYTEGGVGRDYLIAHGVPESKIIAETQSSDTGDSARRIAVIMRTNNLQSCTAVSDGYHTYRIKRMMASYGITQTFGSPRPLAKPLTRKQRTAYFLREVLSITLWRLHLR